MHFNTSRLRIGALLALTAFASACADRLPTEPMADAPLAPSLAEGVSTQATRPGYIRIGVVPSATAIKVGGTGDFVLRDKTTGEPLLSGSNEQVEVSLGEGAVSRSNYRLQVTCTSEAGRDALIARAKTEGYATYAENAGPCWRVMLGEFDPPPASTYSARVAFKNEVIAKGLAGTDSFWKVVTITEGSTEYRISHGGGTLTTSSPVLIEASSGHVLIGGNPYRGIGEVALNSSGALAGINELPIEEYLYGVVPRELPPTVWPEVEAQKAQAVAARTYALSGMGKRRADGYDLLPTTSDQVYGGYAAEHPLSNQAVDGTRGVVATYEGKLIQALFSSTTGGYTSSNEEVYNSAPVPYLRGVPDAQRGEAFAHVPSLEVFKRHANPTNLRAAAEGDFEADWSRYHRWVYDWTAEEISTVISLFAGKPVGKVLEINALERGPSGRVLRIEYVTESGTFYDTKDRIRSSLKYFVDGSTTPNSLRSTLFFIEPVYDNRTKELVGFKAYGGGWGHGIGLSQTGAVGMAEKKYTYDQILKHYYQGIELETREY